MALTYCGEVVLNTQKLVFITEAEMSYSMSFTVVEKHVVFNVFYQGCKCYWITMCFASLVEPLAFSLFFGNLVKEKSNMLHMEKLRHIYLSACKAHKWSCTVYTVPVSQEHSQRVLCVPAILHLSIRYKRLFVFPYCSNRPMDNQEQNQSKHYLHPNKSICPSPQDHNVQSGLKPTAARCMKKFSGS